MKKVLFIGSLNTKKNCFDGERIKTTFIEECLKKHYLLDIIDLSRFKVLGTLRLISKIFFFKKKYFYCFVSKDRGGAVIIHKILSKFGFDMTKVVYFQIGPFLYDLIKDDENMIKLFLLDKAIIVETDSLASQLKELGFNNIDVLPNFKPRYNLSLVEFKYPKKVLKIVYFSRIEQMKGIYQLLDALIEINHLEILFEIDIFGIFMSRNDKKTIKSYLEKYSWISYCGTISATSEDSYKMLQNYDLHAFPTLYGEGFPGTLIDFFIAGVPTLSSTFARHSEVFAGNESILFKQGDIRDLKNKLKFIYNSQDILNEMRKTAFERGDKYTLDILDNYIERRIL